MHNPTSFFWFDFETSGVDPKRDRPLQFAGLRTDLDFNPIDDPLVLYCSPADDFLPHPMACLITGITPQIALEKGCCEAEFIGRINAELAQPGTCAVGYNSLRFDDEITRYTLYRNFFDPYAREWQNGCSRWDIIDMLRLARALRPEGVVWPEEEGRPTLKLERLTQANGLKHAQAHDALSDVYATIAMAKKLREAQPKLFEYVFSHRSKQCARDLMDITLMKPVLHVSSRFPVEQGNLAIIAPLCQHPSNPNAVIAWDLRHDPSVLERLSVEEIAHLLFSSRAQHPESAPRIALKLVHLNRCPILAPAGMLGSNEAAQFDIDTGVCREHLDWLRNHPQIKVTCQAIFGQQIPLKDSNPDHMLYSGGFFSDHDRRLIDRVRASSEEQLSQLELPFQDPRLPELLIRYKARNFPQSLSADEHLYWENYRSQQLLGPDNDGCLHFTALYAELNRIATEMELSSSQQHILEEIALYAESIYPMENE